MDYWHKTLAQTQTTSTNLDGLIGWLWQDRSSDEVRDLMYTTNELIHGLDQ